MEATIENRERIIKLEQTVAELVEYVQKKIQQEKEDES
jgi:hypothetical protein